jgi:O6-methylguanine-DNA--protein-cysteine methyltransferase
MLHVDFLTTPIGELLLAVDQTGALRVMHFADEDDPRRVLARACHVSQVEIVPAQDPGGVTSALRGYFAGDLEAIDAVRVLASGTPFQREVWDLLRTIPCGTTTTYGRTREWIESDRDRRAVSPRDRRVRRTHRLRRRPRSQALAAPARIASIVLALVGRPSSIGRRPSMLTMS